MGKTTAQLIEYAKNARHIIRNHKLIDFSQEVYDSFLGAPPNSPDQDVLMINKEGSRILDNLRNEFYQFEDSFYKKPLIDLLDKTQIDEKIFIFLRKKELSVDVLDELIHPKQFKWDIFLTLEYINIRKKTDFKVAVLHPPGMRNVKNLNSKKRSEYRTIIKFPSIQIKNIKSPTLTYAFEVAKSLARPYLALIPNRHASFSYNDDIKFKGFMLGYNKDKKHWLAQASISHKSLFITEYEDEILKTMGRILKTFTKRKSDLSKRILGISDMLFAAKSTQYPPAKLLLLVTVLESLFLESTFNTSSEYKKINKRAEQLGNKDLKVKIGVYFHRRLENFMKVYFDLRDKVTSKTLKFVNDLYDKRSEVTHVCEKHKLTDKQVQIVEQICMELIGRLCAAKCKTHLSALRKIGVVTGKV